MGRPCATSLCYCSWADLEKFLGGGQPNIVGAQLNVLLELQLRTSLVISQIPVLSANTRLGKSHIWGGIAPLKSACAIV